VVVSGEVVAGSAPAGRGGQSQIFLNAVAGLRNALAPSGF
jgi:hypothetical protein